MEPLGLSIHQWASILALVYCGYLIGIKAYYQAVCYVIVVAQTVYTWEALFACTIAAALSVYIGGLLSVGR